MLYWEKKKKKKEIFKEKKKKKKNNGLQVWIVSWTDSGVSKKGLLLMFN